MNETLQSVDWDSTLSSLNVNDSWGCFKAIYQDAIDRCVPVYKAKPKKNLWMNSDFLQFAETTTGCSSD